LKGDLFKLALAFVLILFIPSVFCVSVDTFFIDSNNHNSNASFMIESPTAVEYDGVWYVIYESDDYHFYLAKSFDEGETWSKQKLERATHGLWPQWGTLRPSSLFIKDNVLYWVYPAATASYASWVSLEYSNDFGQTWSSVNRLSFHDNGIHNNIVDDGNKLFILEDDRGAKYNTFDYSTKTSSGEVTLDCVAGQWGQISDVTKVENNKYILCRKSGGGTNLIKIEEDYNQTTTQVFATTYDHYELTYGENNTLNAVMKLGSAIYFSVYDSGTETFSDPLKISDTVPVSSRPTTTTNQENDILALFTDTNSDLYLIYYDLDSNTWFSPTKVQGITNASHPKFSFHKPSNKIADDFQILIDGNLYWAKFTSLDGLGINYFLNILKPSQGKQILQRDGMLVDFEVKDTNYNHTPVYEIQYKLDDSDEWTEKTITGYEQFFGFTVTAPDQTGEHTLTIRTLKNGKWISNSVNYEVIPREIDLKVNFIKAIQVIEDVDLVAGKKTAVKVEATNENNTNQPLDITIRLEFNDKNFLETKTFVGDSNFIFYVDNPYEEEGEYTITTEIDSNEKYAESNENNNYENTTVTVKNVRILELVYVPVDLDTNHYVYNREGFLNNRNYYIKNLGIYYEDINKSYNFLFSSYPIKEKEVSKINRVFCLDPLCVIDINYQDNIQTQLIIIGLETEYLLANAISALSGKEFRIIGITPAGSTYGGLTFDRSRAVLSNYPEITVPAHEIGHSIWNDGNHLCEEYQDNFNEGDCANPSPPNCTCFGGNSCLGSIINNGIWVEKKEQFSSVDTGLCNIQNTFSFMGSSDYNPPIRWASYDEYQHIFSALEDSGEKSGGSDMNILLVSGLVDIDLNVELKEFYIVEGQEFGSTDGNCAIRTTDTNGLKLNDYNFAVSFTMQTNPPTDTNYSSFILGIPFDENINSVQAICNGELKAERFVSDNAPTVSITSPSGSEEWSGDNLIEWTANDLDEDDLEFVLQYSDDDGLTWNPLGMHVTDENFTFDVGMVDGNTSYKIKVIATDGVLTGEDTSGTFSILNPDITIVPNEWNLEIINELQNVSQDFNIVNSGNADLNVFDMNVSDNLTVTGLSLPLVLKPNEVQTFNVILNVLDMNLGEFNEDINLGSNDPNQIVEPIRIYGEIEEAKSDFRIIGGNITFSPVYPDENQNVVVSALIENLGDLNASNVNVKFYDGNYLVDGNLLADKNISFIDANSSEVITADWNSVQGGEYNVFVVVDDKNLFDERDESNNEDFNSLTVYVVPVLSVEFEYSPLQDFGDLFDLNAIITNNGATLDSGVAKLILPDALTTTDSLTKTIGGLNSHVSTKVEWVDINSSEAGLFELIVNVKGDNADENFSGFVSVRRIELSELDVNEFILPDENIGDFNIINFNPDITYSELYYAINITGPDNYSFDENIGSLYAGETKNSPIEWDYWKQTGQYTITVSLYDYYNELISQKQDSFEIISYTPSLLTYYSTDGVEFNPEFTSDADYFSSAADESNQVMVVYSYNGDLNYSIRNPVSQEWTATGTIGTGNYPYLVADGNNYGLVYVDENVYYKNYNSGWGSAELVSEMSSVDPVLTFNDERLYVLFSSDVNGTRNIYLSGFNGVWNKEMEITHCTDANCSNPVVLDDELVSGKLAYGYRKFTGKEYSSLDSNLMFSLFDVDYFYWGNIE